MRITKISVKELFGDPSFNYEIELKKDPPITIIHGRNGSGKTVIFKMVHGLFNSNYFIFWKYPFREFRVGFDDEQHVSVTRDYDNSNIKDSYPTITYSKHPDEPFVLKLSDISLGRLPRSLRNRLAHGEDVGEIMSLLMDEEFEVDYDDRFLRHRERQSEQIPEPEWLRELSSKLNVNLIDTNRLHMQKQQTNERRRRRNTRSSVAIEENSEDLSQRIQAVIFRATTEENTLNRTFPNRVVDSVNEGNKDSWTYESVKPKLEKDLKEERKRLVEVGLLEPGEQLQLDEYDDKTLGSVLRIYIEDTEKKLDVYRELADKIELFKDIVEAMLIDKNIVISKEGFEIKSSTDRSIPLRELSSGEQHMIVLMYNLLFRDSRQGDELILIDEPEISLHIIWQQQFISSLEKISKLSKFDVMIATHSPAIVDRHWDLEVVIQSKSARGE